MTLRSGYRMPVLSMGVWQYNDTQAEATVSAAIAAGFTHIDTAYDYHNQQGVAKGMAKSGKPREELFITTKVPGCGLQNVSAVSTEVCRNDTAARLQEDFELLGVSYIDLVLLHFPPCPGDSGTGMGPSDSSCYAKKTGCTHPGACALVEAQWGVLSDAYAQKKIRSIGVSNYCSACFSCLASAEVAPMVNQVQLHVGMGQDPQGFRSYAERRNFTLQAWSPLGSGGKGSPEILGGNLTTSIAKKYNKSTAQVALRWLLAHNVSVATKSSNPKHMAEDLGIFGFELSDEDLQALDAADFASDDSPSFLCADADPPALEAESQEVLV